VIGAIGFALFDELRSLSPMLKRYLSMQEELASTRSLLRARQTKYNFAHFIGTSAASLEVKRRARRSASAESPVLLLGETGTGKELLAQAIHGASPRAHKAFVSINSAAIPEALLEAEFFGTAPGAFTGADRKGRTGKLQIAQGGTLFLDEIGDMPLPLQSKLLRVLQEKEFEPVGSNEVIQSDVRVIAATSTDPRSGDQTRGISRRFVLSPQRTADQRFRRCVNVWMICRHSARRFLRSCAASTNSTATRWACLQNMPGRGTFVSCAMCWSGLRCSVMI
jgi:transcriptional regulator with PAS, ATPase and Fis domain